jgi:large subunit ribosomal protein L23
MTDTKTKAQKRLDPTHIVIRPIVTEKGTHQVERHNTYSFRVHPLATKEEIKRAVEELFGVTVVDVRTLNRVGKRRRFRMRISHTKNWKKAYVTLSEADRINLF